MSLGSFADKGGYQIDQDFVRKWKAGQKKLAGQSKGIASLPGYETPKAPPAPRAPSVKAGQGPEVVQQAAQGAGRAGLADDAQAAAARAQAVFDATSKRAAIQAAGSYDASDLEEAIRRMLLQRPDEENAAKNTANAAGLASSSTLVKNLGDIGTRYVRGEADARQAYGRRESERQTQLGEVGQAGLLSDAAIDAALADRLAQRDADAAANNALPPKPLDFAQWLRTHKLKGKKWVKA